MKKIKKDSNLEQLFMTLGLSQKEAKIYNVLLRVGHDSVSSIISKSGLKRGITYAVLYSLERRGLIKQFKKEGKTCFLIEDPRKLHELIREKKNQVEFAEKNLSNTLPKLTSQYKLAIGKPIVRYYEGEEGVRNVFNEIYQSFNKEALGCVDPSVVKRDIWETVLKELMPHRIKNKVRAEVLNPDTAEIRELKKQDKEHLREIHLVDTKKYPLPCEIDVWDDKVAFMSFKDADFIAMIIENQNFAITLHSVFRLCFDLLRQQEKKL